MDNQQVVIDKPVPENAAEGQNGQASRQEAEGKGWLMVDG
jgi:hypothetical protein